MLSLELLFRPHVCTHVYAQVLFRQRVGPHGRNVPAMVTFGIQYRAAMVIFGIQCRAAMVIFGIQYRAALVIFGIQCHAALVTFGIQYRAAGRMPDALARHAL